MENYGSYQPQQINARYAQNSYVNKKEEEKEKIQKAVACTIGTLVGVGLASLVGYGIINKISSKNSSVNKATEEIKQSAQKNAGEAAELIQDKCILRTFEKIKNNANITKDEITQELNVLVSNQKKLSKTYPFIDTYIILLQKLLDKFETNSSKTELSSSDYTDLMSDINKLEKPGHNSIQEALMTAKVKQALKSSNMDDITKLNVDGKNLKYDAKSFEMNDSDKKEDDLTNFIQIKNDIYIEKYVKDVKDDTVLYIKSGDKVYETKLGTIKTQLNPVETIKNEDVLNVNEIDKFEKKEAKVLSCQVGTGGTEEKYLYGQFTTTTGGASELKYVKIADLVGKVEKLEIVLKAFDNAKDFDSGAPGATFANAVKDSISSENLGQLLDKANSNPDLKTQLQDTTKGLGKILIADWVADKGRKTDDIVNVLKGINKFDKDSVGAAFANAVLNSISSDDLGQLLNEGSLAAKLVDSGKGELTAAGKILIADWVTDKERKSDEIAKVLNAIKDFGDNSVGEAFAKEVAKLNDAKLSELLNKANSEKTLKDKLVDDKGKLTDAGKILINAIYEKSMLDDFVESTRFLGIKNFKLDPDIVEFGNDGSLQINELQYNQKYFTQKFDKDNTEIGIPELLLFLSIATNDAISKKIIYDESSNKYSVSLKLDKTDIDSKKCDNTLKIYNPTTQLERYINLVKNDDTDNTNTNILVNYIEPANLGKLLNDSSLTSILVKPGTGELTDVGKILIAGWVEQHKGKPDEIANVLKEIKDFGDKSVGAAFAKEVAKLDAEKLGKLLDKANDYSDLKTQLQETTKGLGKILITNWVDQHKGNTDEIANVLKNIDNFDKDSVGEAFANAIWTNKDIYADTYLDLLQKDNLKDKLQDTDKGLGKIFISDKLKKKNISVVSYIIGNIDQKKCEKGEIGEVFLQKVIAKMSTEDIALVFTDTNFKLTDAGKKFITNWVDQHKGKPEDIAKVLTKFTDNFAKDSVGEAFIQEVAKLDTTNLGQVLKDEDLSGILVDSGKGELTAAGKNFIKQLTCRLPEKYGASSSLCRDPQTITNVTYVDKKNNKKIYNSIDENCTVVQIGKYRYKCRLDGNTLYIRSTEKSTGKYSMNILPPLTSMTGV